MAYQPVEYARRQLDNLGFSLVPGLISPELLRDLRGLCNDLVGDYPEAKAGLRFVQQKCPAFANICDAPILTRLAGDKHRPVRTILFNKTPEANWAVAWHQDMSITVTEKKDVDGYGPWTRKDGVPHVQAPTNLLERMVTVRLHFDDAGENNGALRVIPGSHTHGKLDTRGIVNQVARTREFVCAANAGDALLMKPLLLHASFPSETPRHRRVLHIEFANPDDLADELEWAGL